MMHWVYTCIKKILWWLYYIFYSWAGVGVACPLYNISSALALILSTICYSIFLLFIECTFQYDVPSLLELIILFTFYFLLQRIFYRLYRGYSIEIEEKFKRGNVIIKIVAGCICIAIIILIVIAFTSINDIRYEYLRKIDSKDVYGYFKDVYGYFYG